MNTNANEQEWTLDYKPNLVSCEKKPQTFVSDTEKIAQLIGEEILTVNLLWNMGYPIS